MLHCQQNRDIVVVDLFAGAGGLSLGLEAAGFKVAVAVEKDAINCEVYQKNFPNTKVICTDICSLEPATLTSAIAELIPNWDGNFVLCGGPPCQGFSIRGKRDPADGRNRGLEHFFRLVRELSPTVFVMENVMGLDFEQHNSRLTALLESVKPRGYAVTKWKLNAADYGVPQSRSRVFWVGSLLGIPDLPEPTPSTTVRDAIASLPQFEEYLQLYEQDEFSLSQVDESTYATRLRDRFPPPPTKNCLILTGCTLINHSAKVRERFNKLRPGEVEPVSRSYRLKWEGLARTLLAGGDSDHGRHTAVRPIHPAKDRMITVREAARLASFPDWFDFHPTKWRSLMQIGNAVPPLLANAVGLSIQKLFTAHAMQLSTVQPFPPPLIPSPSTTWLDPSEIILTRGTQSRATLDWHQIERYASAMQEGSWEWERTPLPIVYWDGTHYYACDCHLRVRAALKAEAELICVEVRFGTVTEAILNSCAANSRHDALPLTPKDQRKRIELFLEAREQLPESDPRRNWSDYEIAAYLLGVDKVGRDNSFRRSVFNIRKEIELRRKISYFGLEVGDCVEVVYPENSKPIDGLIAGSTGTVSELKPKAGGVIVRWDNSELPCLPVDPDYLQKTDTLAPTPVKQVSNRSNEHDPETSSSTFPPQEDSRERTDIATEIAIGIKQLTAAELAWIFSVVKNDLSEEHKLAVVSEIAPELLQQKEK